MSRFRAAAIAFFVCTACRYWSGADPAPERNAPTITTMNARADDWEIGRLTDPKAGERPLRGGEIVVQIHVDPPSLNHIVDSDLTASRIVDNRIYESLVSVDPYDHPNYRIVPGLAERWEISSEQRVYSFWLRHGVTWHDGVPFTARDVVATFDKIQDPTTKAMHVRAYTADIESYRALDDYRVEFRFKRPYFMVMDGIFAEIGIQPAHRIERLSGVQYNEAASNPLNRHPIGTGPFRFDSWQSNQHITLARNDAYWGRVPYLDRVVFRIVKEATIALELAERQELDLVYPIRAEQWVRMDRRRFEPHYQRSLFYEANYQWIGYNENRRFFQDARVRRAMTMLVDRPGIISALQHGLARPTTCHFYFESAACDPALAPLPYDPVAACALLDEAGWRIAPGESIRRKDGEPFSFTFMMGAGSEDAARMGPLIKESMLRAGIDMRLQRVEWSAFVKRLRSHDFDACTLLWGGGPRGDPTQIWHTRSIAGGSNYIGFSSPRADAIIDAARAELDEDRRNRLFREFGRILHEEQPYTWLFVRPAMALIHRRVHGARTSLVGWRYEDWWVDAQRGDALGAR